MPSPQKASDMGNLTVTVTERNHGMHYTVHVISHVDGIYLAEASATSRTRRSALGCALMVMAIELEPSLEPPFGVR